MILFILMGIVLPIGIVETQEEDKPLHSKVKTVTWDIGIFHWWNGTDHVIKSSFEFNLNVIITNSQSEPLYTSFVLFYEYEGPELPNHTLFYGLAEFVVNSKFDPGKNTREFGVRYVFMDEWISSPLPGKFTFWVSDLNSTIIGYTPKTIRIFASNFMNFLCYDYEYFIIGVVSVTFLGILSWFTVKKIHYSRLNPILSRKLDTIERNVDFGDYSKADSELEEILPEIELLNDTEVNRRWNRLKKRCNINIGFKKRLDTINSEIKKQEVEDTRAKLLSLLKEIHLSKYKGEIDPLIESEIVSSIKSLD